MLFREFCISILLVASPDIPDNLRQFIFEHVDSLALLDVLFLMRIQNETWFDAEGLSRELRTSAHSVAHRFQVLGQIGLLREDENRKGFFKYAPRTPELEQIATQLAEFYRIKPHKVLELIFSTVKRARQFADAFAINKSHKIDEDDNG